MLMDEIVRRLRESKYKEMSTDDLITQAQDGDERAMETLLINYEPLIYRMINKHFPTNASYDQEDIKMVAMEALWDAILKYESGDFEAFAGSIIRNKLADLLRAEGRDKRKIHQEVDYLDNPVASDGEGGEATLGDMLPSKSLSTEDEYIGQEGYRAIMDYIQKLSASERDVILRYIRGQKVSEIAEETGMKYKSVENAIGRAKGKVAEFIKSRTTEARNARGEVVFTPEEIKVLESIITRVNKQERISEARKVRKSRVLVESAGYAVARASDEDMSIEDLLDDVEAELDEIEAELADIPYDARDDYESIIDKILDRIQGRQDDMTDEEYYRADDLSYRARRMIEDAEYEGPITQRNHYSEIGMRPEDF